MASEQEILRANYHDSDDDDEEEEENEDEEEEEGEDNLEESKIPGGGRTRGWSLGRVLDPRTTWVQEWNRVFLLVCATGLFVDPLFFYALSVSDTCMCLFVDGWFAVTVTVLRCMTDALHVWNMWLQLKMNKLSYAPVGGTSQTSRLHKKSARSVALGYLKAKKGFFFDLFVILPLPQVRFLQMSNEYVSSSLNFFKYYKLDE